MRDPSLKQMRYPSLKDAFSLVLSMNVGFGQDLSIKTDTAESLVEERLF
jgi:hypothetical protein